MTDATDPPKKPIEIFADYYTLLSHYLVGHVNYEIENAGDRFNGHIDALRIVEGTVRFGNIFYQILFATLIARQLDCKTIGLRRFELRPIDLPLKAGDVTFVAGEDMPHVPTLAGPFFNTYSFGSLLNAVPVSFVVETIDTCLKPLFARLLEGVDKLDDDILVLHFRSGDVFRKEIKDQNYVQPPASFYTKSIEWAQKHLDIKRVRLVYEDRGNPAVAITESFLSSRSIPFESASQSVQEDFQTLLGARHLVAGVGTFCETAALLSAHLRTLISFRNVELFADHHWKAEPFLLSILRARGQQSILVKDVGEGFISPTSWLNTPAQVELIAQFPSEQLQITDGTDAQYDLNHLNLSLDRAIEEIEHWRRTSKVHKQAIRHFEYLLSKPLILKIIDHFRKG
jgi:hypothetical protein